jgi:Zn-dependent M28 family amino/carboxypeptidase
VRDPGRIPNVVARLSGSDDAETKRVLLVAHLDHIGVDESAQGDVVFNGADDNGSGVAALLEIAEELARRPRVKRPRYTVEFLFTGGEEAGLLGARAYLRIGAADTGSVAAVLNLDMVSRNADDLYVLDGPHAQLGDVVRSVLASRPDLSLTLRDAPDESQLFRRSDHFAFSEAGIPAVWLFTGFHADYHAVTDEVSRIDADKAARVARLVLAVIDSL